MPLASVILDELRSLRTALRAEPRHAPSPVLTVDDLWRRFDEAYADRGWWKDSGRSLSKPTSDAFAGRDVLSLTRDDWRRHLATRKLRRGSPRTLLSRWRAILSWASKEGLITRAQLAEHPWRQLEMPKAPPPRRTEIEDVDLERLLSNARPHLAALVTLLVDTSLRLSSALAIEWSWVDLEHRRVRIPAELVKNDLPLDVPLSTRTVERFKALRRRREGRRSEGRYVFGSSRTDAPFTRQWAGQNFRRLRDALEISAAPGDGAAHVHDLRGTSAARVIRAGANLRQLMQHLAIKQAKTADSYIQRFSDEDREHHRDLVEAASKGEHVDKSRGR